MGQIILQASFDFSGFVLPGSRNSCGRPKKKRYFDPAIYRGIKLFDNSNKSPSLDIWLAVHHSITFLLLPT
jgi:hypothetical protein